MGKKVLYRAAIICCNFLLLGCYSFTGATISGKSIYIKTLENNSNNIVPSLSANLTQKIRTRILSQTGLSPKNNDDADYILEGVITNYQVTISGVSGEEMVSTNRLTITVMITFENKKDEKGNFETSFSRFADFPGSTQIQSIENKLIDDIGESLADDIFNKAFVNW